MSFVSNMELKCDAIRESGGGVLAAHGGTLLRLSFAIECLTSVVLRTTASYTGYFRVGSQEVNTKQR